MRGRRRQGGFGVIEVIIAMLLLAAAISAVALAVSGGSAVRGSSRLQIALTSAGRVIQENLVEHRDWMSTCTSKCDLKASGVLRSMDVIDSADSIELDDVDGRAVLAAATAEAVDSESDGVGDHDQDGVVPDYYRIQFTIEPEKSVAERYAVSSEKAARTFMTAIDPRGNTLVGSLVVNACRVTNQIDNRMSIQGCPNTGSADVGMAGCPTKIGAAGYSSMKCTAAWNKWAVPNGPSMTSVNLVQAPLGSFSLQDAVGTVTIPSSKAKHVNGQYVFQNVPAGLYYLRGLPGSVAAAGGSDAVRWEMKEIPAYHGTSSSPAIKPTVTVEPGIQSRALVMFKPAAVGNLNLAFKRRITTHYLAKQTEANTPNAPHPDDIITFKKPLDTYTGTQAGIACKNWAKRQDDVEFTTGTEEGAGWSRKREFRSTWHLDAGTCVPKIVSGSNCAELEFQYRYRIHNEVRIEKLLVGGWEEWEDDPDKGAYTYSDPVPVHEQYCAYYKEWMTFDGYLAVSKKEAIADGAAVDASYRAWAAPEQRTAKPVATNNVLEAWNAPNDPAGMYKQCRVSGRKKGTPVNAPTSCNVGYQLNNFEPGLYTGLESKGNDENMNDPATPASSRWIFDDAFWVRPDGTIKSSGGTTYNAKSAAPVTLVGAGECYVDPGTTGLFSGVVEGGRCGVSCVVADANKVVHTGYCGIITKACTYRYVWEEGRDFASNVGAGKPKEMGPWTMTGDGAVYGWHGAVMAGKKECVDFPTPWLCVKPYLKMSDDNCNPQAPRPTTKVGTYKGEKGTGSGGGGRPMGKPS